MCHKSLKLHEQVRKVNKAYGKINKVDYSRKKLISALEKTIKAEKPSEAERFFLNNEDILN